MTDPADMSASLLRELRAENSTPCALVFALDKRWGCVEDAPKSVQPALEGQK